MEIGAFIYAMGNICYKLLILHLFKEYLEYSQLHFPYILLFFNYANRQNIQILIAYFFFRVFSHFVCRKFNFPLPYHLVYMISFSKDIRLSWDTYWQTQKIWLFSCINFCVSVSILPIIILWEHKAKKSAQVVMITAEGSKKKKILPLVARKWHKPTPLLGWY